jgi:hypothetical protein
MKTPAQLFRHYFQRLETRGKVVKVNDDGKTLDIQELNHFVNGSPDQPRKASSKTYLRPKTGVLLRKALEQFIDSGKYGQDAVSHARALIGWTETQGSHTAKVNQNFRQCLRMVANARPIEDEANDQANAGQDAGRSALVKAPGNAISNAQHVIHEVEDDARSQVSSEDDAKSRISSADGASLYLSFEGQVFEGGESQVPFDEARFLAEFNEGLGQIQFVGKFDLNDVGSPSVKKDERDAETSSSTEIDIHLGEGAATLSIAEDSNALPELSAADSDEALRQWVDALDVLAHKNNPRDLFNRVGKRIAIRKRRPAPMLRPSNSKPWQVHTVVRVVGNQILPAK